MKRKDDPEDFNPEDKRSENDRLCALHHAWLKEHTQYLKDIFVTLRGNGKIESGMQWKQAKIVENITDLRSDVTEITNAIKAAKTKIIWAGWIGLATCATVIGKWLVLPLVFETYKLIVAHGGNLMR